MACILLRKNESASGKQYCGLSGEFEEIGMTKVWCGYYEGNIKSKRVQEKVGFHYQWKSEGVDVPLMHEKWTGHVSSITKDQWQWDRMYEAAAAVRNERKISDYVTCGEVSAAILSSSGRIYTGVCVDTSCSTMKRKRS